MRSLSLAIDCGTSTIKAAVFDLSGQISSFASRPLTPIHEYRRIEYDPRTVIEQTFAAIHDVSSSLGRSDTIDAVSVTNQRASVIGIGKNGQPVTNLISWQDMRGDQEINQFSTIFDKTLYTEITGLPLHPVYSLGKILWCSKHLSPEKGIAKYALVQDFILNNLGAPDLFTDTSNASLTGILDIRKQQWSDQILNLAKISNSQLPILVQPGDHIGEISAAAARSTGLKQGIPLIAGGGDKQCAAVGMGALQTGIIGMDIGTAATTLYPSTQPIIRPDLNLHCCVGITKGCYFLEGLQSSAGATLLWISNLANQGKPIPLNLIEKAALMPPQPDTPVFLPWLNGASGLRSNPKAGTTISGLQPQHDLKYLIKAFLEGLTYETSEILTCLENINAPIAEIRVSGGLANIKPWNQLRANIFNRPVTQVAQTQASLLGAAIIAFYGIGKFDSLIDASDKMVRIENIFYPSPEVSLNYQLSYYQFSRFRDYMLKYYE